MGEILLKFSQLTRPNGCILQATLVTNLPESSLSSPAPGTFEIGQAFPITVGSIEDSCTILRCIAGLSSLLEKSWSWQVNGLFSEESIYISVCVSICVALTRPWQRLGYWSFCLLTSWERESGGEKKHPVQQAGGGSESRICRDSRLPDIANHLQRSRCPSHYTDLATGERWNQGFWNMCRTSCRAAIVPPPVIFVSIGVLLG